MAEKNKNPEKADKAIQHSILGVENATPKVETEKESKKEVKEANITYIMKVTKLSWGPAKQNHFYAYNKPVISKKAMGKRHGQIIDIWLKAGWIEKSKY